MQHYRLMISPAGELTLPENVRQQLRVEDGGPLILSEENGRFVLEGAMDGIARAQAIVRRYVEPGGPSVVDELIAERRAEALRE